MAWNVCKHRVSCLMCAWFAITLLALLQFTFSVKWFKHEVWVRLDDWTSTAAIYHRAQRPLFRKAAKSFKLHYVWSHMEDIRVGLSYDEIVTRRFASMRKDLEMYGRDDARIEKDKCEMYRWIERNHLPVAKILKHWSSNASAIADFASGEALSGIDKFPVFLKCCHLTQGSAKSVRPVKSKEWAAANRAELASWLNDKWSYKADDHLRVWRDHANKLTEKLVPGFILQASAPLSVMPHLQKPTLLEMRVEVFWGRAYMALLGHCMFFLRGETDKDAVLVNPLGIQSVANAHKFLPQKLTLGLCADSDIEHHNFIADEGYMECVWKLAERTAKLMMIDYVRVDVMIARGKPDGCMINELSLSSGFPTFNHQPKMAEIWAEMYTLKEYEVYGDQSSKPLYLMEESDVERAVA
eukprot:TRINITY_DN16112_c0_g1_i1.p1 TRINITY_DN16112_c0_g1~~TRINITY_DN16112_c0_g1_i1.p1  ORF type:complete len:411 (+),score=42.09 TRINITY_DN16112_c0_g1_i1:36-1268(+)